MIKRVMIEHWHVDSLKIILKNLVCLFNIFNRKTKNSKTDQNI